MPSKAVCIWAVGLGLSFQASGTGVDLPKAVLGETAFDFGEVVRGRTVDHEFVITNRGAAPLVIHKVAMTPPLRINRLPSQIPPGGSVPLQFLLDTSNLAGRFEGQIILFLNDVSLPEASLALEGNIVNIVEVVPIPAFFVSAIRGYPKEQALEIVNHDCAPLTIEGVRHPAERFTTRLETLLTGQRYRLTVAVRPEGPAGRSIETIEVRTSNPSRATLRIPANIWVHERVYAAPDEVDFGTIPLSALRRSREDLAQTIMLYQAGGKDFRLTAQGDVPQGIELLLERGPSGDRYQMTVILRKDSIAPGPLHGVIQLETNDTQSPRLVVPVRGSIVDN
jgi:hypothetical protein